MKKKRKKSTRSAAKVAKFKARHSKTSRTAATRKGGLWGHGLQKISNFVTVFEGQAVVIAKRHMKNLAERYSGSVKNTLYKQRYQWKRLSPSYAAWKAKEGLDPRKLIATKTLVQSIRPEKRRYRGRVVSYAVGPPRGIHPPSGLTFKKLCRIHEFGSEKMKIPARPLWYPAWRELLKRERKVVVRELKKEVMVEAKKAARNPRVVSKSRKKD